LQTSDFDPLGLTQGLQCWKTHQYWVSRRVLDATPST
jgi:hypothetical protein